MSAALFNACDYLLDRHVREGRGGRLALTGTAGDVSYAELAGRVARAAVGLRGLGLQAEQRVVMVMADSPEFVVADVAGRTGQREPVPAPLPDVPVEQVVTGVELRGAHWAPRSLMRDGRSRSRTAGR